MQEDSQVKEKTHSAQREGFGSWYCWKAIRGTPRGFHKNERERSFLLGGFWALKSYFWISSQWDPVLNVPEKTSGQGEECRSARWIVTLGILLFEVKATSTWKKKCWFPYFVLNILFLLCLWNLIKSSEDKALKPRVTSDNTGLQGQFEDKTLN